MRRILYLFMLLGSITFLTACEDEDAINLPKTEDTPLILPRISQEKSFYNADNLAANPSYAFTVDFDARGVNVASVEVYKSWRRLTAAGATEFTKPRILHQTLTNWPTEVNVPVNEVVTGFSHNKVPLTVDQLTAGRDIFIFTFEVVRTDGSRIIYTPLNSTGAITGAMALEPYAALARVRKP